MRKTVNAKSLHTPAIRALTCPGSPAFLNFFVVARGNAGDGRNPPDLSRTRVRTGRTRVTIYSEEILPRVGGPAQVPQTWAYGLYASYGRSLFWRGTTLTKESVLLPRDPPAQ